MAIARRSPLLLALLLAISSSSLLHGHHISSCRCLHGDPNCWPQDRDWKIFNASIQGRLIAVKPPAWPCHDPHYDHHLCELATENWSDPAWRSDQPGAMMADNWEMDDARNESCSVRDPRSSRCEQGSVPVYAVNVSQVFQVELAVAFASKHNLLLVVKNTGHDYLGRSTARGSLSIWMHHLRELRFHGDLGCDQAEHCDDRGLDPAAYVTIGAGVTWNQLYEAALEHRHDIVGASCPWVGAAGGFAQGGGHSLLSPVFGLAADNVVELQVVTADGKRKVASEWQNEDLFWALRGGGGGTFGVVVSLTYRTYPALENAIFASVNVTAKDRPSFETLLEEFARMNPELWSDGWSGFFNVGNFSLSLRYVLPNKTLAFACSSLNFLLGLQHNRIQTHYSLKSYASFYELIQQALCGSDPSCPNVGGPAGNPVLPASRLIPTQALNSFPTKVSRALAKIALDFQVPIVGALVAGGQVSVPRDSAVNPAWRDSLWLVIVSVSAPRSQRKEAATLVSRANKVLIDITPGSGSYMNEADYNEPHFQRSFFGSHYKRLYEIKQRVDPGGLFVCHHCVGSEDWTQDLRCKTQSNKSINVNKID
ncbi:uncharacterized FAD-linked oxidoreductase ARB_02478 [Selaginella moellendorffii]|nr:uncharacterized FAD-linked oxidoreductase ARB_02478 [Selaginella moellendorffii]|eukprot:XP_002982490.2 uncharacterized FAD-linked oxidoreductase ARB_02478 [Selaginella moellendorffii]